MSVTFLYDWKKILRDSDGKVLEIFRIFRYLTDNELPQNHRSREYRYSTRNYKGQSFLINPEALLYNSYKYTYKEIAQYLAVASLRPLSSYFLSNETRLCEANCPIESKLFENNRLLTTRNGYIYFKYEEVIPEK